jgi:hypothetical protein
MSFFYKTFLPKDKTDLYNFLTLWKGLKYLILYEISLSDDKKVLYKKSR